MINVIADAMIEAGLRAMLDNRSQPARQQVEAIYLAMEAARPSQLPLRDVEETKAEVRRVLSRHKAPLSGPTAWTSTMGQDPATDMAERLHNAASKQEGEG